MRGKEGRRVEEIGGVKQNEKRGKEGGKSTVFKVKHKELKWRRTRSRYSE